MAEDHDPEDMRRFVQQGGGIREVLQAVEDALVDAGYDDFVVATERGSFHWQTAERAREEMAEDEGDGS
jgi:hypothetical protein